MIRGALHKSGFCQHFKSPLDVVGFRFACCEGCWACRECHDEAVNHETKPWPRDDPRPAVMCGACGFAMTAKTYLARTSEQCPCCDHPWNPGCRDHEDRYFA